MTEITIWLKYILDFYVVNTLFIMVNFNFCPIVWHFCSTGNTNKIEKIQERAFRFLYNDYVSPYLQRRLRKFEEVREKHVSRQMLDVIIEEALNEAKAAATSSGSWSIRRNTIVPSSDSAALARRNQSPAPSMRTSAPSKVASASASPW